MIERTPSTPMQRISRPFIQFMHIEASGGFVLLACTVFALIAANSHWAEDFAQIWKTPLAFTLGELVLSHTIAHWINDGLMTVFFFVVGLEIKRELVAGELKEGRAAILPIMAALGGMIVPALVYTLALGHHEGRMGWGIPMATDIAFVVGFLSLFGRRVPHGLKIFILSLAIVDDLGAILVIAVVYSSSISTVALSLAGVGFLLIRLMNRLGVRSIPVYVIIGIEIWFTFLMSGIHPTIAGVMLGLLTPASAWVGNKTFIQVLTELRDNLNNPEHFKESKSADVQKLMDIANETVSPLERLEVSLHPWVAFFIMPVFALANAGVPLSAKEVTQPISVAVTLGLFIGKPLGIVFFSFLATRFMGARLPLNANWGSMFGAGFLAGIGFTMSVFIASLALEGTQLNTGKVGTLLGSFASALAGLIILHLTLPKVDRSR